MNKKEIAEVRKQFSPINCNITRVASCCITAEKELISQKTEAFLSLAEENADCQPKRPPVPYSAATL